jgi:uncharacterized protein involved in exopolysaccharide biosynthesis
MVAPAETGATDELDLAQFWKDLTWSKAAIVSGFALGIASATVISLLAEPVYRASALIVPVSSDGQPTPLTGVLDRVGSLAALAGIELGGPSDSREVFLATLVSRGFTLEFIETNNLLPLIFHERWDAPRNTWNTEDAPTRLDAWEVFDQSIRSLESNDSGIYTLAIEWRDPEQAAVWANSLIERVNERIRAQAIREADESIGYLNAELEQTNIIGVEQAVYRLIENQVNRIMLANVRKEYAFRIVDPAIPPDRDKYVWPNYVVLLGGGAFFGICAGLFASLLLAWRHGRRDSPQTS